MKSERGLARHSDYILGDKTLWLPQNAKALDWDGNEDIAENGGPTMLARSGVMRALNRHIRESNSDRRPHLGKAVNDIRLLPAKSDGVPELTRSVDIKLNKRVSLPRREDRLG
jgi:hypothetical protein